MKSEYFTTRAHASQLRGKREKIQSKQVNWDRIVYIVLLILAVCLLFYYVFTATAYVSGDGQVVTEVVDIRTPDDIEIQNYHVSVNDDVQAGDSLFSYTFIDWRNNEDRVEELFGRIEQIDKELEDVADQIILQRTEIAGAERKLEYLESERDEYRERVRLNASTALELNAVERDLFNANSELSSARTELDVLINRRYRLLTNKETEELLLNELMQGEVESIFRSPVNGTVQNILVKDHQQAFRSERLLTMASTDMDVYIFSVFERDDAEDLTPGTVMNIEFDNGEKSVGVIRDTYDAREDILQHFNQTGSLVSDYLVVELDPANASERTLWMGKDRSGLQVYKSRLGRSEPAVNNPRETTEVSEQATTISEESREASSTSSESSSTIEEEQQTESVLAENSNEESDSVTTKDSGSEDSEEVMESEGGDYAIIVLSLKDRDNAEMAAEDVRQRGYSSTVVPVTLGGEQFWRVTLGRYATPEEAVVAAETIPEPWNRDFFVKRIH